MAGEVPREDMSRQILSQENQALKEKNTRLMIENSSLQGKLRGYATLGESQFTYGIYCIVFSNGWDYRNILTKLDLLSY